MLTMEDLHVDLYKCRIYVESVREETRELGVKLSLKVRSEIREAVRSGHDCPDEMQQLLVAVEYKACHS